MNRTILGQLLDTFVTNFTGGAVHIAPDALMILALLFTIELVILGLWYAQSHDVNLGQLVMKVATVAAFAWLIHEWPQLSRWLAKGFIAVGLKAGGDIISETDFTDPGNIALYGMGATAQLFAHLAEYNGLDAIKNLPEIFASTLVGLMIILTYFALALWIFLAIVEFYALAAVSVALLGWGVWTKTAFIAEKAIAVMFASAIRLLVLAFITSSTLPILQANQTGLNPSLPNVLQLLLSGLALLMLSLRADKLAQGLLHGSPNFHTADLSHATRHVTNTLTRLGGAMQTVLALASRTDANHPSRAAARRRV